jgi:WD40 repeat protein
MFSVAVADEPQSTGADAAANNLNRLERLATDPKADAEQLWQKVVAFRRLHPGTVESGRAALLLTRLRTPLDRLDPKDIPAGDRFDWQPKGLVAVLGEHTCRHWGVIVDAAFSPDGRLVASVALNSDGLRLWDVATMRQLTWIKGATSFAFAPDGKTLAVGLLTGEIRLCEPVRGQLKVRSVLPKKGYSVERLTFARGGRILAVKYRKQPGFNESYSLWRWSEGKPVQKELASLPAGQGSGEAFAGSSLFLYGESNDALCGWEVDREHPRLRMVMKQVRSFAVSADGKTLVTGEALGNGQLTFWDVTPRQPKAIASIPARGWSGPLTWSPDGSLVAGVDGDRLLLWSKKDVHPSVNGPEKPAAARAVKLPFFPRTLRFSPDSRLLVFGAEDGSVRLWDVAKAKDLFPPRGHCGGIEAVFSPDGRKLATAGGEGTLRLWDLTGPRPADTLLHDFGKRWGTSLTFSPGSDQLAYLEYQGRWVRLWDLRGAKPRALPPLRIPEGTWLSCLRFSPKGDLLIVAGAKEIDDEDNLRRTYLALWRIGPGRVKPRIVEEHLMGKPQKSMWDAMSRGIVLAPDGRHLVLQGARDFRVWDWSAAHRKETASWRAFTLFLYGLAFSPDGAELALCGLDHALDEEHQAQQVSRVRLWDMSDGKGKERSAFPLEGVNYVAWALGGSALLLGTEGGACLVRDRQSGKTLWRWKPPAGRALWLAVAPDGRHLALGNANGTVYIVRLKEAPKR